MNIFVVSSDPYECSLILDDRRLNKMILETAQILSTAAHLNGAKTTYKPTHKNHPCVRWATKERSNYYWLWVYFCHLDLEYKHRFNKVHKSSELIEELQNSMYFIEDTKSMDEFPNCTVNKEKGISFKHVENVHDAYKMYLNARWKTDKIKPKWTNRNPPEFYDG